MEVTGLQNEEGPGRRSCCLLPAKPCSFLKGRTVSAEPWLYHNCHPILQEKGPLGLLPLKNWVNVPAQPAAPSPPPARLLFSRPSHGSRRPVKNKALAQKKSGSHLFKVTGKSSEATTQVPPSPSTPSLGLAVASPHSLCSYRTRVVGRGAVTSHVLGVLLLMIESKRPSALLARRAPRSPGCQCLSHAHTWG